MSEIRIPVSLKFDTETDVYKDLIVELRDNRELSPFIVEMLTIYYEDEELRELLNYKREQKNPYSVLHDQLTKINIQHTKTIMATSMLANQTQGIISGLEKEGYLDKNHNLQADSKDDTTDFTMNIGEAPTNPTQANSQYIQNQPQNQQQSETQSSDIDMLMRRMDKIEQLLPNINDKLEQLLSGGVTQTTSQPPQPSGVQVEPTGQLEQTKTQPTTTAIDQASPTLSVKPQPVPNEAPTITIEPTVEPSLTIEPTPTPAPTVEPSLAPTPAPMEEEKPSKPASFGKALSSLKKK